MKYVLTVTVLSLFTIGALAKEYPVPSSTYSSSLLQLAPDSTDTCLGVTIVILDTVFDNQNPAEIRIGVSGGTLPYTFFWDGPNGYTSTVQNPNDIPHQGVYNVVVTDSLDCEGTLDVTVVPWYDNINELNFTNSLSIFPNPNQGVFTLKADDVTNGIYTVTIRNLSGQEIYLETFFASGTLSKPFEIPNLENGMYFVELANEVGNTTVIKLIKR